MLKGIASHFFSVFGHLGGFGLLILGALDSSPLFVPLGNDLLVIALVARKHKMMAYYSVMAAIGSTLGCLCVDFLSREGGEKGLQKIARPRLLQQIKRHMRKRAAWTLAVASLMPPPFPFTPFVAGAAALQYPRKKLLGAISVSRFVRFLVEGVLAIHLGRRILRWAHSPLFEDAIVGLAIASIAGSAFAILSWIKRSKAAS